MFSLSKIALFSLISFATLAFAIPAPEARSASAKALLYNVNDQIATAMLPVACATSTNATADYVAPLLTEVTQILDGLVSDLEGSDLSGCTTQEILTLLSNLLSSILDPVRTACSYNSGLVAELGDLVSAIVQLVQVVLKLVGALVTELLFLLLGNGCVGTILGLNLVQLIDCLDLGNLIGNLNLGGLVGSLL